MQAKCWISWMQAKCWISWMQDKCWISWMQDKCWISLKSSELHVSAIQFYLKCNICYFQCKQQNEYVFAQRPHTVVWARTGGLSTHMYLIECAGRVTWAYFQRTVLCISHYSMFLILNTCVNLRAFSNRLLKSLLI